MQIIDGKLISEQIKAEIATEVEKIKKAGGKVLHLAVILVGNDGASETYVALKVKDCE
jgi:methylenetetrahydrofolate dehydrogenase (NADP+)/methenyltetrahydrofolate cyclohydrolase